MIELKNISKSYGRVEALRSVNVDLDVGIYALLGPNGSGKTTLMKIISGLLTPSGGQVLYNGTEIKKMGPVYRSKIGYMPQYPAVYPSFAVKEFLLYCAELKALGEGSESQIDRLLDKTELSDVYDRRISELSGGMKQRLSLCAAVLGDPEILILDEPTAGLDPKQRAALRRFVKEISPGKLIIWATHIVPDVEKTANGIIFMKKGVAAVTGNDAGNGETLEEKYLSFFGDVL